LKRSSGVLLHISSLPGPFAAGALGRQAREFADLLAEMGCSYWQVLPVGHHSGGGSPFASRSLFALNPGLIDPYALEGAGLLTGDEIGWLFARQTPKADMPSAMEKKRLVLLRKAYTRVGARESREIAAFAEKHAGWLDAYALFITLKNYYGDAPWGEWPAIGLRLHKPDAVARAQKQYENEIMFWKFVQYTAYGQWAAFREYANSLGIGIIGVLPAYASLESSDVWAGSRLFQLNAKHMPKSVGGAPPDAFCKNGRLWGCPLYDWDEMRPELFEWWVSRIGNARALYDAVIIDHFRGLHEYWAVPYANKTAKKGEWRKGPGAGLIDEIKARFGDATIIADDTGADDRPAREFVESAGFPGIRVMQRGFGESAEPGHMIDGYPAACAAYTGTHDDNTVLGWYEGAPEQARADSFAKLGLGPPDRGKPAAGADICRAWIESLFGAKPDLAIVPIQDLLCEGADARMNDPGAPSRRNWAYRVDERKLKSSLDVKWVAELNKRYNR